MKKGIDISEPNNAKVPNKKERHIVSWSQEEDDILREQIGLHGTENWAIIASNFTDKSMRQCRRRWFSYLNSDFKKGGWSPEEDALLLEAQRAYGNRWTEIAKVVPGRTDNAVKNRFTTLCKKRSKQEELAKENSKIAAYLEFCNRRAASSNGINGDEGCENGAPLKKMRTCILNTAEASAHDNVTSSSDVIYPDLSFLCEETTINASENMKDQGTFLKRDDPKMLALIQQSELLSSLATKVNSEKTDRGLDSAWMVMQNHLKRNKGSEEDLRSCNEGSLPLWWESDTYESSPSSSEYSARSTDLPCNKPKEANNGSEAQQCLTQENGMCTSNNNTSTNEECSSPLSVTPMFRELAAAIPSPKFSESEKRFLMKTLGVGSPSSTPRTDPLCKRSLLNCL